MQLKLSFIALTLSIVTGVIAAADNTTEALIGINCNGSGLCSSAGATLGQLQTLFNNLDNNRRYGDGDTIGCLSHLCAFFQLTGTTNSGATVKTLIQQLINHGCGRCGSAPTLPGNNVDTGELTVNYVSSPVCQGIC